MMPPSFVVYCGPMMSSKTTSLIRDIEKMRQAGKNVVVFKPAADVRYSETEIVTHDGLRMDAVPIATRSAVFAHIVASKNRVDAVAVDEAFMIDGIADSLWWLFCNGVSVVVATLDMSYTCQPFPETMKLTARATQVKKMLSTCSVCGLVAAYTVKMSDSDKEIEVGGHELYSPRCWLHHPAIVDSRDNGKEK